MLAKEGKAVKMIELPVEVRVASTLRLFQHCLQSMHSLKLFGMSNSTFYDHLLSPGMWQQMAEFELDRPAQKFHFMKLLVLVK